MVTHIKLCLTAQIKFYPKFAKKKEFLNIYILEKSKGVLIIDQMVSGGPIDITL